MAKKGNWVCEDCGKDCGNPPALELHRKYCKVKKEGKTDNTCNHDYRLLNPRVTAEDSALKDGYLQVCTKCLKLN